MTAASVQIFAQERFGYSTLFKQLYHITLKSFVGVKEVRCKTYADFLEIHKNLIKDQLKVPQLPPKNAAGDKKKRLNTIARGFEAMLNELMSSPQTAGHPKLCRFLQTTPEIALYGFKQQSQSEAAIQAQQSPGMHVSTQHFDPAAPTMQHQKEITHQIPELNPFSPLDDRSAQRQSNESAQPNAPIDTFSVHSPNVLPPQQLQAQQPMQHYVKQEQTYPHQQPAQSPVMQIDNHFSESANGDSQLLEQYTPDVLEQYTPTYSSLRILEQYSPLVQDPVPAGLEGYTQASPALLTTNEFHLENSSKSEVFQNNLQNSRTPTTASASKMMATPQSKTGTRSTTRDRVLSPNAYEGQYSGSDEVVIQSWIEELTEEKLILPLQESLKSGVILCKLVNKIQPQTIKRINNSTMPFPQRENIKAFCDAARELGVPDSENFNTDDLFDKRNFKQVLICLFSLGRQCYYVSGYQGPALGRPEKAQLGAANDSKFEVKADALWGKGNSQFKAADGRPSSGQEAWHIWGILRFVHNF